MGEKARREIIVAITLDCTNLMFLSLGLTVPGLSNTLVCMEEKCIGCAGVRDV